jgi:superfamily I DNA and/or RNA helicase/very-short-patch-repair endonuclease
MSVLNFLKYYKQCVLEDQKFKIEAVINNNNDQNTYYVLRGNVLTNRECVSFTEQEIRDINKFIEREKENGKEFYYGYPILIVERNDRRIIKPLFYFKINYDRDNNPILPDIINLMLNYYFLDDLGIEEDAIVDLIRELNLENQNFPDLVALTRRFKEIFPNFNYDPKDQNFTPAIYTNNFGGVIFSYEAQQTYTQGLQRELNDLITKAEAGESFQNSCLKYFINPKESIQNNHNNLTLNKTFLEVYELNNNQKKAIELAFQKPVTVVTGPPGTGKSQVVASLILNAAINGQKILFSSKNHKAIEVIEDKINEFFGKPFMIRLGNRDGEDRNLRQNLINFLNNLIQQINPPQNTDLQLTQYLQNLEEKNEKLEGIENQIKEIRELRNKILKLHLKLKQEFNENDEQIQDLINKLKSKETIRRKNLLNKKIKNASKYIRVLNHLHKLPKELEDLLEEYENVKREFIESSRQYIKLWYDNLLQNINIEQRQLLTEYIQILNDLNNNLVRRNIRNLINRKDEIQTQISDYFNAWCITNLSIRNEFPLIEGFFDILVIDEASQCDIASVIPLLYRSKRVIILGDPNQLRHITTINPNTSLRLLEENQLSNLYDYRNSFFDLSSSLFGIDVILNEHFRSHPDIISFSNRKWYNNQLIISTDHRKLLTIPINNNTSIEWINVNGEVFQEYGRSAYNDKEIECIIEIVKKILENNNFPGEIGIVTPFRAQANKIREKLNTLLNDYQRLRVLVNTIVKFQGDEKDIIIFSPVISDNNPDGILYYLRRSEHLLNVAITRAKSKLIVVGNRDACLNAGIDIYRDFVYYIDNVINGNLNNIEEKSESPYERILAQALSREGIRFHQQYIVGQYRLDFAIIDETRNIKIDVEVDGKNYHTEWTGEQLKKDILRNHRLEQLGWKVVRLWTYEIRDDLDYCLNKIKKMINI